MPPLTTEILLVFSIITAALVLFILEPIPIDIVAIGVLVSLIVLEPWTGVSGFASSATLTVLAMFVISEGIRRIGLINIIGNEVTERYGSTQYKQLLAVTFGASTAMLTPIGNQTNLMIYGPGGYNFTDFLRVGAPLQLLLAVVTTAGLPLIWGV